MIDQWLVRYVVITTAILGGVLSVRAYRLRAQGPATARAADRLYLLSYVITSLSIAAFAVSGFLR